MKINKKALELIEKGLSSKTVLKLDESQINVLHSKMVSEVTMVSKNDTDTINSLKSQKKPFEVYEKDLEEQDDLDDNDALGADAMKSATGQDTPHMADDMAPDGMDDDSDNNRKEMGESKKKEDGPNPWAICHSQVGPKKSRKFERCVQSVKKQLKEGKNPVSLFLETQIERIVEKHIPPRITKGDLMKVLSESEPTTAPTKPKTKPGTKPDTRPRPSHPGKNPNPGENPAPKAKKVSPEQAKDKVIDVIMNLLKK